MTLVRFRNPELRDTLFPSVNTMMKSFWNDLDDADQTNFFTPKADVVEMEKSYAIEIALPGLDKDAIKIDVKNNSLVISGERKFKNEEKSAKYHKVETHYGSFTRSFGLPENVKGDAIEAEFKNGMLHISIPKAEQTSAKTVSIK